MTTGRAGLVFAGAVVALGALTADLLTSNDASIGPGQTTLTILGLLILAAGALGRRKFLNAYRGAAIVLLNTILLLVAVEVAAMAITSLSFPPDDGPITERPYESHPYYTRQRWAAQYWRDARESVSYRYAPYVVWRLAPYASETVNLDSRGVRRTPAADCAAAASRLFVYGGSTMLGWGAPDWGTIPAFLQSGLEREGRREACVVNMGVDAYVSTQAVLSLMLELKSGNVPDVALFYDGVNDVRAAYESGRSGAHLSLQRIAERYERQEPPLLEWLRSTRTYSTLEHWMRSPRRGRAASTDVSALAESVAADYRTNREVVASLAEHFGFRFHFFLQPHLGIGDKALTEDEQKAQARMDSAWLEIARATYPRIATPEAEADHFTDLSRVFDADRRPIWIDEAGHVTPEGNRLVATAMLAALER